MTLVEWPDRAAGFLPAEPARHRFDIGAAERAECPQRAHHRLRRLCAARPNASSPSVAFSTAPTSAAPSAGAFRATPRPAATSGSTRDGATYILMNSPKRPDGPPVRGGKPYSRDRASGRKRDAVHRHGARAARARLFGAGDLRRRSRSRPFGASRISATNWSSPAIRRLRSKCVTRRRPICWRDCISDLARDAPGRAGRRSPAAALRHRCVADRGGIAARLVSAASSKRRFPTTKREAYRALWRDALVADASGPPDLGAARLSFAQSAVAAGARGHRAHRPARFPGRA